MPKAKCSMCQSRARRQCPVVGDICPACCGSKRNREINCPTDCEHNLFAIQNYDQYCKIEYNWPDHAVKFIVDHYGKQTFEATVRELGYPPLSTWDGTPERSPAPAAIRYLLGVYRDENGKRGIDHWREQKWRGLTNDKIVIAEAEAAARPVILEVREVLDDRLVKCLDLLRPEAPPILMCDRALAQAAFPFAVFVAAMRQLPAYCRMQGVARGVNQDDVGNLMDELQRRAGSDGDVVDYMQHHFGEVDTLVAEYHRRRQENIRRRFDPVLYTVEYKLNCSHEEAVGRLHMHEEFDPVDVDDGEGYREYAWLQADGSAGFQDEFIISSRRDPETGEAIATLGYVKLWPERLDLVVVGQKKLAFLESKLEEYFGTRLEEVNRTRKDLADMQNEADEPSPSAPTDIPPAVKQQAVQQMFTEHYRKFLDDAVPALDNMTPRQAAADPNLRPRLVTLMKEHLGGISRQAKHDNVTIDISFALRELGLDELL